MSETWFEITAKANFERFLLGGAGHKLDFLQIGAFRGDASVWLMENVLTHPESTLVDVDTWKGSPNEPSHMDMDWAEVRDDYDARTRQYWPDRLIARQVKSAQFWFCTADKYDFIYIDGSHMGLDVLHDALNAWQHLKPGGILAFDDYGWGSGLKPHERPHEAIDAFLDVIGDQATLIHRGAQVWVANVPRDETQPIPGSVVVGFCSGATTMTTEFRHCYSLLCQRDARALKRIIGEITQVVGGTSIPMARNAIVREFLAMTQKAEWLWFVDTDATFAPLILEELVNSAHATERPIMGGLAFRVVYGPVNDVRAAPFVMLPMLYGRKDGLHFPVMNYPRDSLIKVDGLPTHCMLIHRSVLEDPRWHDDGHFHPWFRMSEYGGKEMSEDLFFCWKANELGYPIHANTKAKTGHEKHLVFDEDLYLKVNPELAT